MQEREQIHTQLLSLMEEALRVSMMLQSFSDEKMDTFLGDDDQIICETIKEREFIINMLVNLEYKIDLILDEVDEYAYGDALPSEIDTVRHEMRKILNSVNDMDMKAMQLLGGRMQNYKDQTLKTRNRKHLSAYIKTSKSVQPFCSYDYKK